MSNIEDRSFGSYTPIQAASLLYIHASLCPSVHPSSLPYFHPLSGPLSSAFTSIYLCISLSVSQAFSLFITISIFFSTSIYSRSLSISLFLLHFPWLRWCFHSAPVPATIKLTCFPIELLLFSFLPQKLLTLCNRPVQKD